MSVELARRSGMFDDWPREKIEAFAIHQQELFKAKHQGQKIEHVNFPKAVKNNKKFNPFNGDPSCKGCRKAKKVNFSNIVDTCKDKTAVVIGKGPSVDKWQEAGSKLPENAVIVGINDIGNHIPCDYVVTAKPSLLKPLKSPYVLFTTDDGDWAEYEKHGWNYFPHTVDPKRTRKRLNVTKAQLAKSGEFYAASSSAQIAIHFAWLLGVSNIMLIGIDGKGGYSKLIEDKPWGIEKYSMMRKDTEATLNILFGNKWKDWA